MPMKVCWYLLAISIDTKKEVKKVYEGDYSFKCIKHSRYRKRHGVPSAVYISAYKSRVSQCELAKMEVFRYTNTRMEVKEGILMACFHNSVQFSQLDGIIKALGLGSSLKVVLPNTIGESAVP